MKKLIVIVFSLFLCELSFAQASTLALNFNQNNFISGTDTFKCYGMFTYLSVEVIPENPPYSYTLMKDGEVFENNTYSPQLGQSAAIFALDSLLSAGQYELQIITSVDTITQLFSLNNPEALTYDTSIFHPQSCIPYGQIEVSDISGGTPPYSLGTIDAFGQFNPIYFDQQNLSNYIIDSLTAGFYSLTLQDNYQCQLTIGNNSPIEIIQGPDPLSIVSALQQDSFRICVQGGLPPYGFVLNGDTTYSTNSCQTYVLCPDNYTLLVFDAVMPISCKDSLEFSIDDLNGYIDPEISSMVVLSGGVRPFSYSWKLNGELQDGQADSVFIGKMCPGQYNCTVVDSVNCSFEFDYFIDELNSDLIDEVDCFNKDFSSLEVNITGGTPPYQYLWNTNETTSKIENLSPQLYTVWIKDHNDCELQDELEVPVLIDSCLYNAFSPNGDQINDLWVINTSFIYQDSEVIVYDRWGAKVFKSVGYQTPWDGKDSWGNLVPEGVYFYSIRLKNGSDTFKGSISVYH
jgi:gliding motility-associated-like protein